MKLVRFVVFAALLGSQGCIELYSRGVVVPSNNPNSPPSPTAMGPTGLGRYEVPRPRIMRPGSGEGLPLPASATPYAALTPPELSPKTIRKLYYGAEGVGLLICALEMSTTTEANNCGGQIDRSLDLVIRKRPVPISR